MTVDDLPMSYRMRRAWGSARWAVRYRATYPYQDERWDVVVRSLQNPGSAGVLRVRWWR